MRSSGSKTMLVVPSFQGRFVVLCRGNPAEDLGALERIEWVLLEGRIMRRPRPA